MREVPFYQGDLGDRTLLAKIAREHEFESCIHFAAFAYVGESVQDPKLYFENNIFPTVCDSSVGNELKKSSLTLPYSIIKIE
jgi:UDP-glucose 4-epimerase